MSIATDKQCLRQHIRQTKAKQSATALAEQSQRIIQSLLTHPRLSTAHTVLLYHSMPDEVCTHPLLDAWAREKHILLPKVVDDRLTLHTYGTSTDLQRSTYGILEPTTPAFEAWEQIEIILVPGVAFDDEGYRLGRGKGYYDRLFSTLSTTYHHTPYRLGICFDFQQVTAVPHEAHDWLMHEVITG